MTWGQKLRKATSTGLHTLVTAEFSKEAIYKLCLERAALGYSWIDIRPSLPIDISKTPALEALKTDLAKEQMHVEWVPIREKPDLPPFCVLRIDWSK